MAQTLYDSYTGIVRDQAGNVIEGATIEVYNAIDSDPYSAGNTLADIYTDREAQNLVDQVLAPVESDANGRFAFYADAGYYHVIAYANGEDFAIADIAIGTAKSLDAEDVGGGAAQEDGDVFFSLNDKPMAILADGSVYKKEDIQTIVDQLTDSEGKPLNIGKNISKLSDFTYTSSSFVPSSQLIGQGNGGKFYVKGRISSEEYPDSYIGVISGIHDETPSFEIVDTSRGLEDYIYHPESGVTIFSQGFGSIVTSEDLTIIKSIGGGLITGDNQYYKFGRHGNDIYAAHYGLRYASQLNEFRLLRSSDGGDTWVDLGGYPMTLSHYGYLYMTICPNYGETNVCVFNDSFDGYVYSVESDDWTPISEVFLNDNYDSLPFQSDEYTITQTSLDRPRIPIVIDEFIGTTGETMLIPYYKNNSDERGGFIVSAYGGELRLTKTGDVFNRLLSEIDSRFDNFFLTDESKIYTLIDPDSGKYTFMYLFSQALPTSFVQRIASIEIDSAIYVDSFGAYAPTDLGVIKITKGVSESEPYSLGGAGYSPGGIVSNYDGDILQTYYSFGNKTLSFVYSDYDRYKYGCDYEKETVVPNIDSYGGVKAFISLNIDPIPEPV